MYEYSAGVGTVVGWAGWARVAIQGDVRYDACVALAWAGPGWRCVPVLRRGLLRCLWLNQCTYISAGYLMYEQTRRAGAGTGVATEAGAGT